MELSKVSLPIMLLLVAVVTQMAQRLWQGTRFKSRLQTHTLSTPSCLAERSDSIFIAVVAYKDARWSLFVSQLLSSARISSRIHIGILYYTNDVSPSIPNLLRHRVRIHYISSKKAAPLQAARRLCVEHLYQNEEYCIFAKSFTPLLNWDDYLVRKMGPRRVLNVHFGSEPRATFPVLRGQKLSQTYLHTEQDSLVSSIAWSSDFSMFPAGAMGVICAADTAYGVSAQLVYNGYSLHVPGKYVLSRLGHPRGVRLSGRESNLKPCVLNTYREWLLPSHAHFGLHKHMSSAECIAKYGSVASANLRLQTREEEAPPPGAKKRARKV